MSNQRQLFVPAMPPVKPGQAYIIDSTGNAQSGPILSSHMTSRNSNSQYYGDTMSNLGNAAKAAATAGMNYARQNPDQVASAVQQVFSSVSGSGKGGMRSSAGALSPAPNPKETHLNTGIPLTIFETPYQAPEENVCVPMHMSGAMFQFPTSSTTSVYDFFYKVLVYEAQTSAQDNVNWAIDIINKFSAAKILVAMNDLFFALQVYYFYRSIDTYSRFDGINQNLGMKSLRESFDYNTLFKLSELSRLLSRTPIPPNMLEFCRYINSNYFSGDTPGSSIIKIAPHAPVSATMYVDNAQIQSAIDKLTLDDNVQVYITLFRAVKNWVLGDPAKLYDPPIEILYDKDFITIFNNLPFKTNWTNNVFQPRVADWTSTFSYNTFTNNLDGACVALTDTFTASPSGYALGINTVPQLNQESRFSFYKVSGATGWYSPTYYDFIRQARQETYQSVNVAVNTSTVNSRHVFGSDMVQNISPNMQKVAGVNFLNWLMSNKTMKNVMKNDFNRPSRGNKRGRGK